MAAKKLVPKEDKIDYRGRKHNPIVNHYGLTLTTRQAMVLDLIYEGKSVKEMAKELGIKEKCVKFHTTAIYKSPILKKFGINNKMKLVRFLCESAP